MLLIRLLASLLPVIRDDLVADVDALITDVGRILDLNYYPRGFLSHGLCV